VASFGSDPSGTKQAARFVWWTRAVAQLGGTPATAVAGFAQRAAGEEGLSVQGVSRSLLACASHLMEEDFGAIYPPGDYRNGESRPNSLTLLVADAANIVPVAALTGDGRGGLLAHPRFFNAVHVALAHLALSGLLPADASRIEQIAGHVRLMSQVAQWWAGAQRSYFVRPDGEVHRDEMGRPVALDERTLKRDDLPWPKRLDAQFGYLLPPTAKHPYPEASHVFRLRHDVVYTIPAEGLDEDSVEATPEALAKVVRRWFPDATGITLTDWHDKFITGVMVGSVFVRLFDRRGELEDARSRGIWYPEGRPPGTKDVLDFDTPDSGAPVGTLLGTGNWLTETVGSGIGVDMADADEAWYRELDDEIIQEVDDALEVQKAADTEAGQTPGSRWDIPVLRLPEIKQQRR
jgi:hypothetical protein